MATPVPSVSVDPSEVGFAADRLARITAHFRTYVDDGRLPGWAIVVNRGGKTAYLDTYGHRDKESGAPIELDTIYRFFSMSKPVTSVAAMMLYEKGIIDINDPVSKYVPCFGDQRCTSVARPPTPPRRRRPSR